MGMISYNVYDSLYRSNLLWLLLPITSVLSLDLYATTVARKWYLTPIRCSFCIISCMFSISELSWFWEDMFIRLIVTGSQYMTCSSSYIHSVLLGPATAELLHILSPTINSRLLGTVSPVLLNSSSPSTV